MRSTWADFGYDQWIGVANGGYAVRFKVTIENVDSAETVELTDLEGLNWVESLTWQDDVDAGGPTLRMELRRSYFRKHLAPTADDTSSNKLCFPTAGTPYLSLLGQRRVKVETCAVPDLGRANAEAWEVVFAGYIDAIDWGFTEQTLQVECRDLSAREQDRFIEGENTYGSAGGGTALKTVMESIASDNSVAVTIVNVGTAPSWNLHPYVQARTSVHDALRALAQQIGYDYRYWYDAATDTFKPSIVFVERALGAERLTFSQLGGLVRSVESQRQTLEQVRNAVQVVYTKADGTRGVEIATDATSITNHGRRFLEIAEGAALNIDSATEAAALAAAVLSDLKDPAFELEVETPYFPWWELYDLETYQFTFGDPGLFTLIGQNYGLAFSLLSIAHTIGADGKHSTRTRWRRSVQTGPRNTWLGSDVRPGVGQAMPNQGDVLGFYFRAYRSAAQSITTGTLTTVAWNAEAFDLGNKFDTGTGKWTCPRTGTYSLHAQARFVNLPDGSAASVHVWITPSGGAAAEYARGSYLQDSGATADLLAEVGVAGIALGVGDVVEIRVRQDSGGSINLGSGVAGTASYFTMKRVR